MWNSPSGLIHCIFHLQPMSLVNSVTNQQIVMQIHQPILRRFFWKELKLISSKKVHIQTRSNDQSIDNFDGTTIFGIGKKANYTVNFESKKVTEVRQKNITVVVVYVMYLQLFHLDMPGVHDSNIVGIEKYKDNSYVICTLMGIVIITGYIL